MEYHSEPRARTSSASETASSIEDAGAPNRDPLHSVLQLQQSIGNRAVQRLLTSQGGAFQTKLAVGAAHDPYETEADRIAHQVVSTPTAPSPTVTGQAAHHRSEGIEEPHPKPLATGITSLVQHAPENEAIKADGGKNVPSDQRRNFEPGPDFESRLLNSGSARPLPADTRAFMEPRFGADFSRVRLHTGSEAAQLNEAISAQAFTHGQNIYLGQSKDELDSSAGKRLLAHELTHTIQQGATGKGGRTGTEGGAALPAQGGVVQRYEAGEHAKFGEAGDELKALVAGKIYPYIVKQGDTPASIAAAQGVELDELLELNKDKIKNVPVPKQPKKTVPGFAIGETIKIQPPINQATRDALKTKELTFKAGTPDASGARAELQYGEGIAMGGDLFSDPSQMDSTPKNKLENLAKLVQSEKTTGKFVSVPDWQAATDQRFTDLATKNESHFAPSNAALVTPSGVPSVSDHKTEWEKYHKLALETSVARDMNKALGLNSFADHFLTDAFAAGHLINKRDVMEKFKSNVTTKTPGPLTPKSELTPDSERFFDSIASQAFPGPVQALYSDYETVEWKGVIFRPNINSISRFSSLLQGIYKTEPDLLANAVALAVHTDLNTIKGGVEVENAKGQKWQLSGDKTLNADTLSVGRQAVAQSELNVLEASSQTSPLDLPRLFKAVWDYVPHPTAAGTVQITDVVKLDTDPKQASLIASIVATITANYRDILAALVARKILKKS
jgi:hypothetical protein